MLGPATHTAPVIWPSNAAPPPVGGARGRSRTCCTAGPAQTGKRPGNACFFSTLCRQSRFRPEDHGSSLLSSKHLPDTGDQTSCPMTELWVQRRWWGGGLEARFKAGHVGEGWEEGGVE